MFNFTLEGSDLAQLYPLTGIPKPPTPAYKLAGFHDHAAAVWKVHALKGKVGDSDLAGEFSLDRGSGNTAAISALSSTIRMPGLPQVKLFIAADLIVESMPFA